MKEFLYLSYDAVNESKIDLRKLYAHLEQLNYKWYVHKSSKGPLQKSIKIQCAFTEDAAFSASDKVLISGETKGMYPCRNNDNLSNNDIISLVESSDLVSTQVEFEGTLTFCKELEDAVVIQNDIEGFRKIFYYRVDGLVCVSTFMPLILTVLNQGWRLNAHSMVRYFCSRESTWPSTLVENISVLEPKTRGIIRRNELIKEYFTFADNLTLQKKSVKTIGHQLKSIYESQYKSLADSNNLIIPLSGGFDSSSVLNSAMVAMDEKPHAISIGYKTDRFKDNNVYNETVYAEAIAKHYKVPFLKFVVDKERFFDSFETSLNIIDQPAFDPSSFSLMSGLAKEKGYTALVSGMGGDALFKSKLALNLYFRYFDNFRKIPYGLMQKLITAGGQRGPLAFLMHLFNADKKPFNNPFDVLDRGKISKTVSSFLLKSADDIFEKDRNNQRAYWDNVTIKSKTLFDIVYTYISVTNPDEYHAYLSAERQNVAMFQPYVTIDSVLELINASAFHKSINSRKYLTKLFHINTDLLFKGKSGLSIPYYDWAKGFAETVFEFWSGSALFTAYVDIDKMKSIYNANIEDNGMNMLIWKLYVVKRYVEKYHISVQ